MACGCSSTPVYSSGSAGGCSTPGTGTCLMPRRVSNPPTVPVVFPWLPRLRQMQAGNLLVRCGDEMGVLDSPVDGTVLWDGATGKAYVGTNPVNMVQDNFACEDGATWGFPLYGVRPECRDMGQNPDRAVAIIRPPDSSLGELYAHLTTCPASPGLRPEIRPVQIEPADFPDEIPAGLFGLGFVNVPAGEDCEPATRKWYAVPPTNAQQVDKDDLDSYVIPAGPYDVASDEVFGLAVWVLSDDGTKWVLKKATNVSLQQMFTNAGLSTNPVVYLEPPGAIADQLSSGSYSQAFSVDLTTQPGYFPEAKEIILGIVLALGTNTQTYKMEVYVDGVYKSVGVVESVDKNFNLYSEVHCKIPASKTIAINYTKTVLNAGTLQPYVDSRITTYLNAFR